MVYKGAAYREGELYQPGDGERFEAGCCSLLPIEHLDARGFDPLLGFLLLGETAHCVSAVSQVPYLSSSPNGPSSL